MVVQFDIEDHTGKQSIHVNWKHVLYVNEKQVGSSKGVIKDEVIIYFKNGHTLTLRNYKHTVSELIEQACESE